MEHTMRSAFISWKRLHNESSEVNGYVRIPAWFRWHIRNNFEWEYNVSSKIRNFCKQNVEGNRAYKGSYKFWISDIELLLLERPERIK